MVKKRSRYVHLLLGFLCSGFFLYLALRQVQWKSVIGSLLQINYLTLLAGIGCMIATYFLIVVRLRLLFPRPLPLADSFAYTMIGYMANIILPFRLGDMTKALLLADYGKISIASVLGCLFMERILDLFSLLVLSFSLSFFLELPLEMRLGMRTLFLLLLASLGLLVMLARYGEKERSPREEGMQGTVLHRARAKLASLIMKIAQGISVLKDGRRTAMAIIASLAAWGCLGTGTMCYVKAFVPASPPAAGFFVMMVVNLGAAIPSTPGFIGVYHYLAMLALSPWIPDKNMTLAFAVTTHAINLAVIFTLGLASLSYKGLQLSTLKERSLAAGSSGRDPAAGE